MSTRDPGFIAGRCCVHTDPKGPNGHCFACADPVRSLRRFRSRKLIRNPARLHEVSRAAKANNPAPFPKRIGRTEPR